jgi:hypothetical protein
MNTTLAATVVTPKLKLTIQRSSALALSSSSDLSVLTISNSSSKGNKGKDNDKVSNLHSNASQLLFCC